MFSPLLFSRLDVVETVEDLRDVYQHFLLHHGRNVAHCQEYFRLVSFFMPLVKGVVPRNALELKYNNLEIYSVKC